MASEEKKINRLIELSFGFKNQGPDAAQMFADMNAEIARFKAANPGATWRDLANHVQLFGQRLKRANRGFVDSIADQQKSAHSLRQWAKALDEVHKSCLGILSPIKALAALVGGQGIGFGSSIKWLVGFQKEMLGVTAQMSKYGRGLGAVESAMDSVGKATGLTQEETAKLYSQYEQGFPYNSLEQGEQLFKNIKAAVGGNIDAMKDMLGTLSAVIEKFPELEDAIANVDKGGNRQLLESQSRLAYMTGKLSLAEHKRFQDYIRGGKQANDADAKRRDQMQAQIDAMNRLRQVFEKLAQQIGTTLMPFMERLSEWSVKVYQNVAPWVPAITKAGLALTALLATSKAISATWATVKFFGGLPGMKGMGAGVGNVAGKAGSGLMGAGRAVMGNPAARGGLLGAAAGQAVDYGYGAVTGRDLEQDQGGAAVAGNVAKTGSAIGVGLATGGPIGGVVAGIASILENFYNLFKTWYGDQNSIKTIKQDVITANKSMQTRSEERIEKIKTQLATEQDPNKKARLQQDLQVAQLDKKANRVESIAARDASGYGAAAARTGRNAMPYVAPVPWMIGKATGALKDDPYGNGESPQAKDMRKQAQDMRRSQGLQREAEAKEKVKSALIQGNVQIDQKQFSELYNILESATQGQDQDKLVKMGVSQKRAGEVGQLWDQDDSADFKKIVQTAARGMTGQVQPAEAEAEKAASGNNADSVRKQLNVQTAEAATLIASGDMKGGFERQRSIMDTVDNTKVANVVPTQPETLETMKQFGVNTSKMGVGGAESFKMNDDVFGQLHRASGKIGDEITNLDQKATDQGSPLEGDDKKRYEQLKTTHVAINSQLEERHKIQESFAPQMALMDAAWNEHTKSVSATNELYQAQRQLLSGLIQTAQTTGNIQMPEINIRTDEALASLSKYNDGLRQTIDLEQQELALADEQMAKAIEINKTEITKKRDVVDESGKPKDAKKIEEDSKEADNLELANKQAEIRRQKGVLIQQANAQIVTQLSSTATIEKQIVDLLAERLDLNKANVDFAAATVSKAEALIDIYDNMGAGLRASAQMRMEAAGLVGKQIDEERKNLDQIHDTIKRGLPAMEVAVAKEDGMQGASAEKIREEANKRLISLQTQRVSKETQILGLVSKQASMTKALRDGYVSAITAMTAGSGMFNKILITQDKNLGIGVKYMNVLQSKSSGGVGGGKTRAGQYTPTGLDGGSEEAGYRTWSGEMSNNNNVQDIQTRAVGVTQALTANVKSGAAGAFGAGHNAGVVLEQGAKGNNAFDPTQPTKALNAGQPPAGTITSPSSPTPPATAPAAATAAVPAAPTQPVAAATAPVNVDVKAQPAAPLTSAPAPIDPTALLTDIRDNGTDQVGVLEKILDAIKANKPSSASTANMTYVANPAGMVSGGNVVGSTTNVGGNVSNVVGPSTAASSSENVSTASNNSVGGNTSNTNVGGTVVGGGMLVSTTNTGGPISSLVGPATSNNQTNNTSVVSPAVSPLSISNQAASNVSGDNVQSAAPTNSTTNVGDNVQNSNVVMPAQPVYDTTVNAARNQTVADNSVANNMAVGDTNNSVGTNTVSKEINSEKAERRLTSLSNSRENKSATIQKLIDRQSSLTGVGSQVDNSKKTINATSQNMTVGSNVLPPAESVTSSESEFASSETLSEKEQSNIVLRSLLQSKRDRNSLQIIRADKQVLEQYLATADASEKESIQQQIAELSQKETATMESIEKATNNKSTASVKTFARDGAVISRFREGGVVKAIPLGNHYNQGGVTNQVSIGNVYRDGGGVSGLTSGESEKGDQYQIAVAGGEVIMNQRQWPRVAQALGMSQGQFANMVQSKDYSQLTKSSNSTSTFSNNKETTHAREGGIVSSSHHYREGGVVSNNVSSSHHFREGGMVGTAVPAAKAPKLLKEKKVVFVYDNNSSDIVINDSDPEQFVLTFKQGAIDERQLVENYKEEIEIKNTRISRDAMTPARYKRSGGIYEPTTSKRTAAQKAVEKAAYKKKQGAINDQLPSAMEKGSTPLTAEDKAEAKKLAERPDAEVYGNTFGVSEDVSFVRKPTQPLQPAQKPQDGDKSVVQPAAVPPTNNEATAAPQPQQPAQVQDGVGTSATPNVRAAKGDANITVKVDNIAAPVTVPEGGTVVVKQPNAPVTPGVPAKVANGKAPAAPVNTAAIPQQSGLESAEVIKLKETIASSEATMTYAQKEYERIARQTSNTAFSTHTITDPRPMFKSLNKNVGVFESNEIPIEDYRMMSSHFEEWKTASDKKESAKKELERILSVKTVESTGTATVDQKSQINAASASNAAPVTNKGTVPTAQAPKTEAATAQAPAAPIVAAKPQMAPAPTAAPEGTRIVKVDGMDVSVSPEFDVDVNVEAQNGTAATPASTKTNDKQRRAKTPRMTARQAGFPAGRLDRGSGSAARRNRNKAGLVAMTEDEQSRRAPKNIRPDAKLAPGVKFGGEAPNSVTLPPAAPGRATSLPTAPAAPIAAAPAVEADKAESTPTAPVAAAAKQEGEEASTTAPMGPAKPTLAQADAEKVARVQRVMARATPSKEESDSPYFASESALPQPATISSKGLPLDENGKVIARKGWEYTKIGDVTRWYSPDEVAMIRAEVKPTQAAEQKTAIAPAKVQPKSTGLEMTDTEGSKPKSSSFGLSEAPYNSGAGYGRFLQQQEGVRDEKRNAEARYGAQMQARHKGFGTKDYDMEFHNAKEIISSSLSSVDRSKIDWSDKEVVKAKAREITEKTKIERNRYEKLDAQKNASIIDGKNGKIGEDGVVLQEGLRTIEKTASDRARLDTRWKETKAASTERTELVKEYVAARRKELGYLDMGSLASVSGTYREGGVIPGAIPRFEFGGTVPNVGESQKGALQALGMKSQVGERTLALVRPGEKIVPQSKSLGGSSESNSSTSNATNVTVELNLGGVQVDYGNLSQVGTLIQKKVDQGLNEVFKQLSGSRSSLPRSSG